MAEKANSGALLIGVLGVVIGVFVGIRWVNARKAYGGWKSARAGVPKAKAGRSAARAAFMVAARAAALAIVLLVVYVVATSTALFKS